MYNTRPRPTLNSPTIVEFTKQRDEREARLKNYENPKVASLIFQFQIPPRAIIKAHPQSGVSLRSSRLFSRLHKDRHRGKTVDRHYEIKKRGGEEKDIMQMGGWRVCEGLVRRVPLAVCAAAKLPSHLPPSLLSA